MLTILALLFFIIVVLLPVGIIIWIIMLPDIIDRQYEKELIYGDSKPVFKLKGGVLTIDWMTFKVSRIKRFLAKHFPKVAIVLEGGKELYFYNGICGKNFVYDGKLSIIEELQYNAIEQYILR